MARTRRVYTYIHYIARRADVSLVSAKPGLYRNLRFLALAASPLLAANRCLSSGRSQSQNIRRRCPQPVLVDAPAVAASPDAPLGLGWSANGEPATAGRH
ncbi:hypothetical protein MRX96_008310 [Rhipicephalus microplus]